MFNRETTKKVLVWLGISLVALIILGYATYASHGFIKGPTVSILQPKESIFSTSTVSIVGKADRIKTLNLNGRAIFIDEQGNFTETVLLSPGYNVETIEARDKFGRVQYTLLPMTYKK
jgi:hypothetical protein